MADQTVFRQATTLNFLDQVRQLATARTQHTSGVDESQRRPRGAFAATTALSDDVVEILAASA